MMRDSCRRVQTTAGQREKKYIACQFNVSPENAKTCPTPMQSPVASSMQTRYNFQETYSASSVFSSSTMCLFECSALKSEKEGQWLEHTFWNWHRKNYSQNTIILKNTIDLRVESALQVKNNRPSVRNLGLQLLYKMFKNVALALLRKEIKKRQIC